MSRQTSSVRKGAAYLLGRTGDKRAVEPLMRLLFDYAGVAFAAAAALDRIEPDWRTSQPAREMVSTLLEVLKTAHVPRELEGAFSASLVNRS